MTYSEYRYSFATIGEFKKAFGKLFWEEAQAMILTIKGSAAIKACAATVWQNAQDEQKKDNSSTT